MTLSVSVPDRSEERPRSWPKIEFSLPKSGEGSRERFLEMEIHKQSLVAVSRKLRYAQTPWENKLWYYLRANRFFGLKFKRQVMIGEYIVDFCCNEKKLIIEPDGGQHNEFFKQFIDEQRSEYFKKYGYKVLRFWNNEIDGNIEEVLEKIRITVNL